MKAALKRHDFADAVKTDRSRYRKTRCITRLLNGTGMSSEQARHEADRTKNNKTPDASCQHKSRNEREMNVVNAKMEGEADTNMEATATSCEVAVDGWESVHRIDSKT